MEKTQIRTIGKKVVHHVGEAAAWAKDSLWIPSLALLLAHHAVAEPSPAVKWAGSGILVWSFWGQVLEMSSSFVCFWIFLKCKVGDRKAPFQMYIKKPRKMWWDLKKRLLCLFRGDRLEGTCRGHTGIGRNPKGSSCDGDEVSYGTFLPHTNLSCMWQPAWVSRSAYVSWRAWLFWVIC